MSDIIFSHHRVGGALEAYEFGFENCKSGKKTGPYTRDFYIIHFVLEGTGKFLLNGKLTPVKAGQAFFITPTELSHYISDNENPWKYMWVGFNGSDILHILKKCNIPNKNHIFDFVLDEDFYEICSLIKKTKSYENGRDEYMLAMLYLLFAHIRKRLPAYLGNEINANTDEYHVNRAVAYILSNYHNQITVEDIAKSVSLNSRYLSRLFNNIVKCSTQNFLIKIRMQKACDLLHETSFLISDIARSVGYKDPLLFSKIFKSYIGVTPKDFRKTYAKEIDKTEGNKLI